MCMDWKKLCCPYKEIREELMLYGPQGRLPNMHRLAVPSSTRVHMLLHFKMQDMTTQSEKRKAFSFVSYYSFWD